MTLPILRVRTNHSEYIIDQNEGRFQRRTLHEDANRIAGYSDGEWHDYAKAYAGFEVGQPLIIVIDSGEWIRSTLVQSIEELSELPA